MQGLATICDATNPLAIGWTSKVCPRFASVLAAFCKGSLWKYRWSEKARRVEVQLVYQTPLPTAPETSETGVGVHMGLTPRVATSDGLRVERRMIDHRRLKRLTGAWHRCA